MDANFCEDNAAFLQYFIKTSNIICIMEGNLAHPAGQSRERGEWQFLEGGSRGEGEKTITRGEKMINAYNGREFKIGREWSYSDIMGSIQLVPKLLGAGAYPTTKIFIFILVLLPMAKIIIKRHLGLWLASELINSSSFDEIVQVVS